MPDNHGCQPWLSAMVVNHGCQSHISHSNVTCKVALASNSRGVHGVGQGEAGLHVLLQLWDFADGGDQATVHSFLVALLLTRDLGGRLTAKCRMRYTFHI